MPDVTIVKNCDARVLDEANTHARALAFRDGILIALGSLEEVRASAGAGSEEWDAQGASVLPGFIDAHHHPCIVALYGGAIRLAAPAVTDIPSLQRALSSAAKKLAPGQWLVAQEWDELKLAERRSPTRQELDDAVPDHPLFGLHYSCHRAMANSRALELAGIDRRTPDPPGGEISRGQNGVPNGLLLERGMSRVESLARKSLVAHDAEGFFARLAEHHRALVAAGITRVVDATVPSDLAELYREAERRGHLIVPTVMLPVSVTGYLEAPWDAFEGPVTGTEHGLLSIGPVKLVFDGAPGCAMCLGWWQLAGVLVNTLNLSLRRRSLDAMRNSMSVAPRFGRQIRTGIQIYSRHEANEVVRAAAERGFALATHAIGNEAISLALTAYEAAGKTLFRAGIPRIEHATFLSRELITRLAAVGASVVAQPHFLSMPAFDNAPKIPRLSNTPLRSLLDAGVVVAGSSDYPVAGFEPLDGIKSAVTRRTACGDSLEPDQAIGLDEALAMYTRSAAKVSGCIDRAGTLTPGKRADFVVLDRRLDAYSLAAARVRVTVLGGKVVFGALDATTPRSL